MYIQYTLFYKYTNSRRILLNRNPMPVLPKSSRNNGIQIDIYKQFFESITNKNNDTQLEETPK